MTDHRESVIAIKNLEQSYDGKNPVLKGINLDIQPGQIVGYIGPNGAGKTTTVNILTGMLDGFSGAVTVLGCDMARQSMEVKKRTGYVPENAALYETLTPLEFLDFIGRIYEMEPDAVRERAMKMLGTFNLTDNVNQRMSAFSKGMKQKVLIASGLIHNPDIIFLDEPLTGLDANTTIVIKEILTRLAARGKTIFYCSHIMDVVERICHRIVIIDKGQIVADGPFEQLQASAAAQDQSLERIFTRLTGNRQYAEAADAFMDALGEG